MISDNKKIKEIQNFISKQNLDDAIQFIEKNKTSLSEIDYWYYLALCFRYQKQYKKALVSLNNIIKVDSTYGRAYQEFGHNYVNLKDKPMALKSYLRAVKFNPTLHASWLGMLTIEEVDYVS